MRSAYCGSTHFALRTLPILLHHPLKQWRAAARCYQELAIEDARALREAGSIAGLQLHVSL
jgi:hypothetical protein